MRRWARRTWMSGLLCLLASCSGQQAALDPAADQAQSIAGLWQLMLWICGVMYVLVLLFLAAAMRRGWQAQRSAPSERTLRTMLTGWTGLIIAGLITLVTATFLVDRRLAHAEANPSLNIKVTAAQWWWKVEYQDAIPAQRITTANELYLPLNRAVRLELHAEDVIHSLWIPNLAGKQDLIPGRVNTLVFTPTRTGRYRGQCAEFCGLQHAQMAIAVTVVEPAEFERWRAQQLAPAAEPTTDQQRRGRELFSNGACAACHQITGAAAAGQTGPNLTHLASRRMLAAGALPHSAGALSQWLADPQTVKPGNHMPRVPLASQDLEALVAYLEILE
jgi:cytochrome c oxidase subunit II